MAVYLEVEQLTAGYGGPAVLHSVSFGVERGEFVALVGPNGCGKSTLIKVVTGALPPRAGRVRLAGREVAGLSPRLLARQVAVVPQETAVAFEFTVEEVVAMGRLPHLRRFRGETAADWQAIRRSMEQTRTWQLREQLITRISGGERQRVLLARALAQEPELLLLDEPTAHLDIAHQVELLDLVWRLNREQGLTVLAVLHDLNLAAQYARRMVVLRSGRIYAQGPPEAVITPETVAEVYGSPVLVGRHPADRTPHVFLLSRTRSTGAPAGTPARPLAGRGQQAGQEGLA